jgi:hypothetical protein
VGLAEVVVEAVLCAEALHLVFLQVATAATVAF